MSIGACDHPTETLAYVGLLEDAAGNPITASHTIVVSLWDAPSGGTKRCEAPPATITPDRGHFRVTLPASCVAAVRAHPNLFVEVAVGATTMPRTRVAAVPYAVEAARAGEATGRLLTTINAVQSAAANPVATYGGKQYSVNGVFCGYTAESVQGGNVVEGALTGAAAAKAKCEEVAGCGATAHVCTAEEVSRFVSMGGKFASVPGSYAWYSDASFAITQASLSYARRNCDFFTNVGGYGSVLNVGTGGAHNAVPSYQSCANAYPIACCD